MGGPIGKSQDDALEGKRRETDPHRFLLTDGRHDEPHQDRFGDHGAQSQCAHEFSESCRTHVKPFRSVEGEGGNDGPKRGVVEECDASDLVEEWIAGEDLEGIPWRPCVGDDFFDVVPL